jgi:lipopolysaccharide transport system permease protein
MSSNRARLWAAPGWLGLISARKRPDGFAIANSEKAEMPLRTVGKPSLNEFVIEAGTIGRQYWRDLWRYRELFYFLAWRDFLVRYKQTVVGVAWSLIRPLLTMLILTLVFGRIGKMPAAGVPYPLLVFCGILPWQFFSTALFESGNSLVSNGNLVSKVYFPRLVVPASSVLASFVDFLISAVFLALLMVWYRFSPASNIAFLPLFVAFAFAASFGAGLWAAALMVKYRDFRFIVPFVVQFGLYISPVGFVSAVIPDRWRLLYSLNPMAGVIDGFRWSLLGGDHTLYLPGLFVSLAVAMLLVFGGLAYFRATERVLADVI